METHKVIFSGRLEFGNARSFEKVLKMFQHRMENYYKKEIILKWEDVFCEESSSLNVPRFITKASMKWWKNTINLLEFVGQYAIAGDLSMWMVNEGKVLKHELIEPVGDKAAVMSFNKGRQLILERGKEEEAMASFSRAIEKFARHSKAYERRGYVNHQLGNFSDAIYDYTKSLDIDHNNSAAYYGRGLIYRATGKLEDAAKDFEQSLKCSIPLEPAYWQSRLQLAAIYESLSKFEQAAKELKFFTSRAFTESNPNYKWRKKAWFDYGRMLMELTEFKASAEAFSKALEINGAEQKGDVNDSEGFLYLGMALHESGQIGFEKAWKTAADKGSAKAAELLAEVSA